MEELDLKPCPFCGSDTTIVEMDDDWYWEWEVYCPECHATFQEHFETKAEAIKTWNRRVDNDKL